MNLSLNPHDSQEHRPRFLLAFTLAFVVFVLLLCRLFYLQIIQGDYFRETAQKNSIRIRRVLAPRGVIYDRNGIVLVDSRPSFNLMLIPHEVKDMGSTLKVIARLLGREEATLLESMKKQRARLGNRAFPLISDMSRDELAMVESARLDLPGVVVDVQPIRHYPHGTLAAHLIGYLGEINERELARREYAGYRQGNFIGKYGVEKAYESILRGQDGGQNVEVDVRGRELRVLNEVASTPGNDLYLTIDYKVQKAAEDALEGREGAIVALNPRNGEVLAMLSAPAFDPSDFAGGVSSKVWRALLADPHKPLNNRVIQGTYAPGSTFKLITAAAGIETGVISPGDVAGCPGFYSLGNHTFRCWRKQGHGSVNLHKAIVQSCDTYFYKLGVKVGVDRLAFFARSFGLGAKTGIPLSGEKAGLIPTTEWKLKRFGWKWMLGETPSVAIGQGYDLLTPLQLVNAYAALGNGGTIYKPIVLRKAVGPKAREIERDAPKVRARVAVSDKHIEILQKGFEGVVNESGGTGGQARLPGLLVAGKTGTAQVTKGAYTKESESRVPYQYRDNAWFVAYAPSKNPQIAVVVLVEHGGHGGSVAAPLARRVLAAYFGIEEPPPGTRQASTPPVVKPVSVKPSGQPAVEPASAPSPAQQEESVD